MADVSRFGHHADPVQDYCIEVDAIVALCAASGPITLELLDRCAKALDFRVGGDRVAMVAKETLRGATDKLRAELAPCRPAVPVLQELLDLLRAARPYVALGLEPLISECKLDAELNPKWETLPEHLRQEHAEVVALLARIDATIGEAAHG